MKTINITTTREAVFARVARQMDWHGTRGAEGTEAYGRVAISEGDRSLLHSFFDEAAMHAIDICRPFLQKVTNTDEALTLRLGISDATDATAEAALEANLFNLMTVHVLRQWLEIVSPDRLESCASKIREADSRLTGALYHHPAPVRTAGNQLK